MLTEWGIRRLDALAARLRPGASGPAHLATGLRGEREAFFFLRRQGFTVVARRWVSPRARGDLDLIAWQGNTLCFLEVKTRTARDANPAEQAVDHDKRTQLRRLARAYLKSLDADVKTIPTRFDIVSVYLLEGGAQCDLLPAAFDWGIAPGN